MFIDIVRVIFRLPVVFHIFVSIVQTSFYNHPVLVCCFLPGMLVFYLYFALMGGC